MRQAMRTTHFIATLAYLAIYTSTVSAEELCPAVVRCLTKMDRGDDCNILPVPARSRLQPIPGGLPTELRAMRKGVWLARDALYHSLILRQGRHLVVVDMPDSALGFNKPDGSGTRLTDAVLKVMRGVTPTRLDMVYTHAHYDHIGGAVRFHTWAKRVYAGAKINIYGPPNVVDLINSSVSKRAVAPTRIVRGRASIVLAPGLRLDMATHGGHTGGDLAIHVPRHAGERALLMFVDVVYPRWAPFYELAITRDVAAYIRVHDELLQYDFDVFLGGHMNPGTRDDVADSLRFAKDLLRAAQQAVTSVTPEDLADAGIADSTTPGAPGFGDVWLTFEALATAKIRRCARTMIEKWGCKVGGLASTIRSHCFTMDEHLTVAQ